MDNLPEPTMSQLQAATLPSLLAELHEKAYRRGFQHGHASGTGAFLPDQPPPSAQQVAGWRFRGYADAEPPPHGGHTGAKVPPVGMTHIDRILAEANGWSSLATWLTQLQELSKPQPARVPQTFTAAELAAAPPPAPRLSWGDWRFDPIGHTLACDGYEIDLEEIKSSAAILDWLFQVAGKSWATPQVLADLVEALDEVLDPQANFCSDGEEQGGDGFALARRHALRALGHRP